jgi:LysR family glycine cleavage system transcriptional activator
VRSVKLMDDWILPVCSRGFLEQHGPFASVREMQQRFDLLFAPNNVWDPWFRKFGESTRDSRWSLLNDSLSILMAAEQGEGIALTRWSLVSRDIRAGRLARPVDTVVKADWSHYFVAPPHYFELPKVAMFRDWLREQCDRFDPPAEPNAA